MAKWIFGRVVDSPHGPMGPGMGVFTSIIFAGTPELAVANGDFAVTEAELQPALRAMRGAGYNIIELHNHMAMEEPRLLFFHFMGVGPARDLAQGFVGALNLTGVERPAGVARQ